MESVMAAAQAKPKMPQDPKTVLAALDNAHFQWFHVKAVIIAGAGFFTDAYDLFVIALAVPIIGYVYYPERDEMPHAQEMWLKVSALVGTLIGQVLFGICGDKYGRRSMYLATLFLMLFCCVGQATSASSVKGFSVVTYVCIWRFGLGIGIGGDYPLSATIASEYANTGQRGIMLAAVFAMQGLGLLTAAIVTLVTVRAFRGLIQEDVLYLDYVWRIAVGLGTVPALFTMYVRSQLPETPRYTLQVDRDTELAASDVMKVRMSAARRIFMDDVKPQRRPDAITWAKFKRYVSVPKNSLVLFGTCSTWFLVDVAFYAQNLFTPVVLEKIGFAPDAHSHEEGFSGPHVQDPREVYNSVYKLAAGSCIVAMLGTVPGYWFTVALVDKLGRKRIQYIGFAAMTVLLSLLAAAYAKLEDLTWVFIVLYSLTFFFANFGPNATTFIVPAECFPTRYRATCHGISAAFGKAGSIVGTCGFGEMVHHKGLRLTLAGLAANMAAGTLCTYFIPETKGRALEEIAPDESTEPEDGAGAAAAEKKAGTYIVR